jgi:hypothetical protein
MEAIGPRTLLVAFAMHALISRSHPGLGRSDDLLVTLEEVRKEIANEAISIADECLNQMGKQRDPLA